MVAIVEIVGCVEDEQRASSKTDSVGKRLNLRAQKGIIERKIIRKAPFSVGYYNFQPSILYDNYPAKLPLDLAEECILQWSDLGETILDPFVGSGTVLRAAVKRGRKGIGLDMNPESIRLCKEYPELRDRRLEVCDSRAIPLENDSVDFILGSPPYGTLIAGKKVSYSKDPRDLSNATNYNEYLIGLLDILRECYRVLKPGAILALVMKERNKKEEGHLQPLPAYVMVYGGTSRDQTFTIDGRIYCGIGFWRWTHRVLPITPYMIWTFGPEHRRKAIPCHEELVVLRKPVDTEEPEKGPEPIMKIDNATLEEFFG